MELKSSFFLMSHLGYLNGLVAMSKCPFYSLKVGQ